MQPSTRTLPTTMGVILLSVVYLIPVFAALSNFDYADVWWHLRVGQWVAEHQSVPMTDPFSQDGASQQWLAYSWLFEVLLYGLYSLAGLMGILLYRVTFSLLMIMACHRLILQREPRFYPATLLLALVSLVLTPMMQERPWLITVLFAMLTQSVILRIRDGQSSRFIWLLPLVYIIWANVHIQFVYGLLLLMLACAFPTEGSRWRLILLTSLCFLATLVNPYHIYLYQVVREYGSQTWAFQIVEELRAFDFRHHWGWLTLLLTVLVAFRLGKKENLTRYDVVLFLVAVVFSFRAKRDLWMIALAACTLLPGLKIAFGLDQVRFSFTRIAILTILCLVMLGTGGLIQLKHISNENLERQVANHLPVEAVKKIRNQDYYGPLFNNFNWGGYLIWALPEHPVVVDGRTNLHAERVRRSIQTWAGGLNWKNDPDLKRAGLIIGPTEAPLTSLMLLDDDFIKVYRDKVATVFQRAPDFGPD